MGTGVRHRTVGRHRAPAIAVDAQPFVLIKPLTNLGRKSKEEAQGKTRLGLF